MDPLWQRGAAADVAGLGAPRSNQFATFGQRVALGKVAKLASTVDNASGLRDAPPLKNEVVIG